MKDIDVKVFFVQKYTVREVITVKNLIHLQISLLHYNITFILWRDDRYLDSKLRRDEKIKIHFMHYVSLIPHLMY